MFPSNIYKVWGGGRYNFFASIAAFLCRFLWTKNTTVNVGFVFEVQSVHPDRGGSQQLRQDPGHGQGS
jgi:hypothetical protein